MIVPERCHGDDGVPERDWNAGEVSFVDVFLGVEHDGGEDDDCHRQRKDKEAQFAGARLESVAENAKPGRVARKLEYSSNTFASSGGDMVGAAGWAMDHPKFWLGGPQCKHCGWPTQEFVSYGSGNISLKVSMRLE